MEKEIRKILKTLENIDTSGVAVKARPEFFEGYKTAMREVLGE